MTGALQSLSKNGNDIARALRRFRNNESTYVKFLKKFLVDPSYEQFKFCMNAKDYENAKNYCSALNGVASNLGLTNISNYATELTVLLYDHDIEQMDQPMLNLEMAYNNTVLLIDLV